MTWSDDPLHGKIVVFASKLYIFGQNKCLELTFGKYNNSETQNCSFPDPILYLSVG